MALWWYRSVCDPVVVVKTCGSLLVQISVWFTGGTDMWLSCGKDVCSVMVKMCGYLVVQFNVWLSDGKDVWTSSGKDVWLSGGTIQCMAQCW